MRRHYVLKCQGCGAPAADCVRICPFCRTATGFEALGTTGGVRKMADGGMHVSQGAEVVIGVAPDEGATRECPFCGAETAIRKTHCQHCQAKIVIERLRVSRLVIEGGRMVIGGGGKVEVVGRRKGPLHEAAERGDLDAVKERVLDGDDPDQQDEAGRRALHYAAAGGHLAVAEWLLSVGADPEAADQKGKNPRAVADKAGARPVAELLAAVGG
ncbi:MAG TPA: ankyrin repeat domain-containing protein [Polyangiaceae bacterium LLY-WYZ-14_1]|nr:ankyrin repeat domain-containing protein [Polyangiaceae bacterium LLY-WYZ-14_1]